jgi:dephospho-CoA kinase
MFALGLTGSIATGKSTALKVFADLGIPVFSADDAVHALYRGAAVAPIAALFPGVAKNGEIDRAALSRQLVADPTQLKALEKIVHPLVRAQIDAFLEDARQRGVPLAVVDIPLLYERNIDWGFDAVLVTTVDSAEQARRALARPGMSVDKLHAILARQMPQSEKIARADYVLDTAQPTAANRAALEALVAKLTGRS